jgi:hypothetical protein
VRIKFPNIALHYQNSTRNSAWPIVPERMKKRVDSIGEDKNSCKFLVPWELVCFERGTGGGLW